MASDAIALECLAACLAKKWRAEAELAQPLIHYQTMADGSVEEQLIAEAGSLCYLRPGARGLTYHVPRPEVALIADAVAALSTWVMKFGMSPSDRTRVSASKQGDTKDGFAQF